MIKPVTTPKPASHPDIIQALRRALELAHESPMEYVSITLHISEKAHFTIEGYSGD